MHYNEVLEKLICLTKSNISQTDIAEALGLKRQAISGRASRNSEFSEEELDKLEEYFKISGLRTMTISTEGFVEIPVRGEVKASMGYGITVYNDEQTATYSISKQLAFDLGVNPSYTEMILASGDSMEPDIKGGDSLLVDLSKKDIYDGRIYCVRIEGQLYAKRLQKIPPHTIKVVSDNKEKYDPFYIDFSKRLDYDFEVIGEVRWAGRIFK